MSSYRNDDTRTCMTLSFGAIVFISAGVVLMALCSQLNTCMLFLHLCATDVAWCLLLTPASVTTNIVCGWWFSYFGCCQVFL